MAPVTVARRPGQGRLQAVVPSRQLIDRVRVALSVGQTIRAVVGGSPVAFGQLHPADHIAYLYCHSAHARRGYAAAILAVKSGARAVLAMARFSSTENELAVAERRR